MTSASAGSGIAVGVAVAVGLGVTVGVEVGVGVGIRVGVGVVVGGTGVDVGVGVGVVVGSRVDASVGVGVNVATGVAVGTGVGVSVGIGVGTGVGTAAGPTVSVGVGGGVGVGSAPQAATRRSRRVRKSPDAEGLTRLAIRIAVCLIYKMDTTPDEGHDPPCPSSSFEVVSKKRYARGMKADFRCYLTAPPPGVGLLRQHHRLFRRGPFMARHVASYQVNTIKRNFYATT